MAFFDPALTWAKDMFLLSPTQLGNMLSAVPLLPLLGALVNGLFGRRIGNERAALIATSAVLGSFAVSVAVFVNMLAGQQQFATTVYEWFQAGQINVSLGLFADHLSGTLLMVVTGIGALIHWYSSSYMEDDEHGWRYFAYLNLFVAAMLLLVLGDNLVTLFVGWEGVGLCSYLLIGFWFTDGQKAAAGRKAFIVNRIGDFGFLIGIFIVFAVFGTTNIRELKNEVQSIVARPGAAEGSSALDKTINRTATGRFQPERTVRPDKASDEPAAPRQSWTYEYVLGIALLCFFIGATGKSAQIPLYVWLPDAMAGPTPVSALIHAATMVTAGVYMIGRLSFMYVHVPVVLSVIAIVGVLTAFFAALMAFAQNDIKKVLAYSTVSQLGFMFVGVGAGAFSAGTFHLFTHAFFKACLFLGAGAVIHGLHHEQDIRNMGGLKKFMPQTRWTFLLATITIAGVLPFSGFFSKDEILHLAHHSPALHHVAPWLGTAVYLLGTVTALFTSFYMFRLYYLTFEGEYRGHGHPHESPPAMIIPLWILAGGSVLAAVVAFPIGHSLWDQFLGPVFSKVPTTEVAEHGSVLAEYGPAFAIAWVIAVLGFLAARALYGKGLTAPDADPLFVRAPRFAKLSENKFYVDEFYDAVIVKPLWRGAGLLYKFVDAIVIDTWLVLGTARATAFLARVASPFQDGNTSRYAAVTAIAVAGLLLWAVAG